MLFGLSAVLNIINGHIGSEFSAALFAGIVTGLLSAYFGKKLKNASAK